MFNVWSPTQIFVSDCVTKPHDFFSARASSRGLQVHSLHHDAWAAQLILTKWNHWMDEIGWNRYIVDSRWLKYIGGFSFPSVKELHDVPPVYWPRLICKCVDGWRMLKETKKHEHIISHLRSSQSRFWSIAATGRPGTAQQTGRGRTSEVSMHLSHVFDHNVLETSWNILKHLETSWNRHVLNNFLCTSRRERWSPWGIKMHQNASTPTNCGISAELKTHKLPGRPAARPALSDPRLNAVLRSKISILWLHEIQSKLLRNLANAGIFLWKGYIQPDSKNNWQFGVLTVIYLLKDEDWTTTSPCSGIYVLTAPTWTEKISHCHRESTSKASQQITGCSLQCCFRRPPLFHRFSFQMLREFCSVLFASLYSIKTRCDYLPDACEFLPQQWVKKFLTHMYVKPLFKTESKANISPVKLAN